MPTTYKYSTFSSIFESPPRNGIYKSKEFFGRGVKLVRMGELFSCSVIDANENHYARVELTQKETSSAHLLNDDLVFSRTSVIASGVGKCSIVKNVKNENIVHDSNMIRIRVNKSLAHQKFIYYFFSSPAGRESVLSLSGGVAVTTITGSSLSALQIPLPMRKQQDQIVSVLSAYDDLIENNTWRVAILEEMARRLYEEWFVQFRYPGHSSNPTPETWANVPFGELLSNHIGGGWGQESPDSIHTEPAFVIRGTDIPGARVLQLANCPHRFHKPSNLKSRKLMTGDIIFEVSGGSHDQSVGRALYVSDDLLGSFDGDLICASFCKRLTPNARIIHPLLLNFYLQHIYKNKHIDEFQVQSTGIKNFQFEAFLNKEVLQIPPSCLQNDFVSLVTPLLQLHQNLGKKNTNLRAQRDLLLPKLISGEIDVSSLPLPGTEDQAA